MPCVQQPASASGYLRRRALHHLRTHGPSTLAEILEHVPPYYPRSLLRYALTTLEDGGWVARDSGRGAPHPDTWRIA